MHTRPSHLCSKLGTLGTDRRTRTGRVLTSSLIGILVLTPPLDPSHCEGLSSVLESVSQRGQPISDFGVSRLGRLGAGRHRRKCASSSWPHFWLAWPC